MYGHAPSRGYRAKAMLRTHFCRTRYQSVLAIRWSRVTGNIERDHYSVSIVCVCILNVWQSVVRIWAKHGKRARVFREYHEACMQFRCSIGQSVCGWSFPWSWYNYSPHSASQTYKNACLGRQICALEFRSMSALYLSNHQMLWSSALEFSAGVNDHWICTCIYQMNVFQSIRIIFADSMAKGFFHSFRLNRERNNIIHNMLWDVVRMGRGRVREQINSHSIAHFVETSSIRALILLP